MKPKSWQKLVDALGVEAAEQIARELVAVEVEHCRRLRQRIDELPNEEEEAYLWTMGYMD